MIYLQHILKNCVKTFNYQPVRWRKPKKPFWLGIAKSKRFIVPEKKKLPEVEDTELQKLQKKYDIITQSLFHFIKIENPLTEYDLRTEFEECIMGSKELISEISKESLLKNEKWNTESAKLREERLKISAEMLLNESLFKIEEKKQNDKELLVKVEEVVKREKVKGLTYITFENLNEAVEKCLNTIVEYNFAIDIAGNRYSGREVYLNKKSNSSAQITA